MTRADEASGFGVGVEVGGRGRGRGQMQSAGELGYVCLLTRQSGRGVEDPISG